VAESGVLAEKQVCSLDHKFRSRRLCAQQSSRSNPQDKQTDNPRLQWSLHIGTLFATLPEINKSPWRFGAGVTSTAFDTSTSALNQGQRAET
jgi:hypothetical protein